MIGLHAHSFKLTLITMLCAAELMVALIRLWARYASTGGQNALNHLALRAVGQIYLSDERHM